MSAGAELGSGDVRNIVDPEVPAQPRDVQRQRLEGVNMAARANQPRHQKRKEPALAPMS
jgi:hypothetical protein